MGDRLESPILHLILFYIIIRYKMKKKTCVIASVYPRNDIDWTLLGFTLWVKEVWSEYVERYDFWPASFEKVFWHKDPNKINTLVWQTIYLTMSLSLTK